MATPGSSFESLLARRHSKVDSEDLRQHFQYSMGPSMAWRFEKRLLVLVHGARGPTDLEWQRLLTETLELGDEAERRIMVVSYGGAPDVDQRKRLASIIGSTPSLTVVMTSSALGRAVTSALSFFNRRMKAVDLNDFEGAFAHLRVNADDRATMRRLRSDLERALEIDTSPLRRPA